MTAADDARARLSRDGGWYITARTNADAARIVLHQGIREAIAAGVSESECARIAGVTRMTVRNALGKR